MRLIYLMAFSYNVVSNAHCKSSPCPKILRRGLGDVISLLFIQNASDVCAMLLNNGVFRKSPC